MDVIEAVTSFYINPGGTAMVYTIAKETGSMHYCLLDGNREHFKMLANDAGCIFESILWDAKGNAFSFVKRYADENDVRNGRNLNLYSLKENKYYSFDANNYPEIKKESTLTNLFWNQFSISDDGKRVFFYMTDEGDASLDNPIVQVWNGNAPWTYRQVEVSGRFDKAPKCMVWFPDSNKFQQLTDKDLPKIILSGDSKYAITYNPMGNKPQFTMINKTDWFIKNLDSSESKLILEDHFCDMDEIIPSAAGKYISYREGADWWVYEIATGKYLNITKKLPSSVINGAYDYSGQKPAYGIAGWTAEDKEIIIYDEYDLWVIDMKRMQCKRLTSGREKQIEFRLAYGLGVTEKISNFDGYVSPLINLSEDHYLKAKSKITKQMGYYRLNGSEEHVIFEDKLINQFGFTKESNFFYCKVQDYDESPYVLCINSAKKITTVAKTNTQQSDYFWGKSKLVSYRNSKNHLLQAALYYPANYDASKKYPMVVYIYEKRSQYVHDYVNPGLFNADGINITNLASQGYFVLEPDIEYEMDNVGMSATDCVVSATKTIIDMGLIEADRIALHGHSFGGYEVSFIATQTKIFATVIAGAGITDVVTWYNSIGWNSGKSEAWRYEDYQS
ncbi:MAG TPA: prolyl oligopeptidase family serine peptidase, partial [Chitinophagaceae bacterium]|nr:prolyl oligopeptidase family serine peptidase [Chitinophagaceae bacterium]